MAEILFIGDDFTGASDTLATLAERGLRTRLFLDAPERRTLEAELLEAVGLATDLRTRSPEEIDRVIEGLAPKLTALSPRFVHYKVCSTFDSSVSTGNIGAAVKALERIFRPVATVVFGGQPSLERFCVFGNLFAKGPDGAVHRIDRHPVMSRHPVTPMVEADLRRHLGAQGLNDLQLVERGDFETLAKRWTGHSPISRFLLDALDQADILTAGRILRTAASADRRLLLVGASGVAEALAVDRATITDNADSAMADFTDGLAVRHHGTRPQGPCLVVAGSRSSTTALQIAAAASFTRLVLSKGDLFDEPDEFARRCAALLAQNRPVLAHLDPEADYGATPAQLSKAIARLAEVIIRCHPVGALGIAGGDTSSAVVHRLGFESLAFEKRLAPGLALCRGRSSDLEAGDISLLLKGGQMGPLSVLEDFSRWSPDRR